MLALSELILGSQAKFAREGATSTDPAGTVSNAFRPNSGDASWIDLGDVEDCETSNEATDVERWAPSPGRLQLANLHEVKGKLSFKLTTNEAGPLAAQLGHRVAELLGSAVTSGQPLGARTTRGWLQLQHYDSSNTLRVVVSVWCRLKLTGGLKSAGTDLVKPQFEANVLWSTLNVVTIS